jgi:5'-nucleotidase
VLLLKLVLKEFPAIGFPLLDYDWNADFESIKTFIKITLEVLENTLPKDVVLM